MLPCFNCQQPQFLIRGLCKDCAPELHSNHNFMLDVIGALSEKFKTETGNNALEDWYRFEEFIIEQLDGTEIGKRFVEILERRE